MNRTLPAALAAALVLAPGMGWSQDSGAATETIPANTCKKPVIHTQMRMADDDSDFTDKADAYKKCINDYVAVQSDLAQKHTNAANAAIADYNAFTKEVNARAKDAEDNK